MSIADVRDETMYYEDDMMEQFIAEMHSNMSSVFTDISEKMPVIEDFSDLMQIDAVKERQLTEFE